MRLTALLSVFVILAFTLTAMAEPAVVLDNGTRTIKAKSSKQTITNKLPAHPYVMIRPAYLYMKPVPHLYGHECTVSAGNRVVVVEQRLTDEARMVKVTVVDGMCSGRSGWLKTENMNLEEDD
jgi:hypothetical protein